MWAVEKLCQDHWHDLERAKRGWPVVKIVVSAVNSSSHPTRRPRNISKVSGISHNTFAIFAMHNEWKFSSNQRCFDFYDCRARESFSLGESRPPPALWLGIQLISANILKYRRAALMNFPHSITRKRCWNDEKPFHSLSVVLNSSYPRNRTEQQRCEFRLTLKTGRMHRIALSSLLLCWAIKYISWK